MNSKQMQGESSIIAGQSLKGKKYWLEKLSGELVKSTFPFDYRTMSAADRKTYREDFQLTGQVYDQLMKLSNGSDIRLQMILTAAVCILLRQYTGNEDVIVGATIERQDHEDEFINTILPLRSKLEDSMTVKDLLIQMRETVYDAAEHQNYPLESLLNDLGMTYSPDEFPLFDVVVLLENIHDKQYLRDVKVNFVFNFLRTEESINGYLEFNARLYESDSVNRIIQYFGRILKQILSDVLLPLKDVSILEEEEKEQALFNFNDTGAKYPKIKCLHELFEEQVEKKPHHTAVIDGTRSISYVELNRKADQLAAKLAEKGVKKDVVVGLSTERSIEMVTAILGILKAGGAYLPLDPQSPIGRIKFMLKDSGADFLLTDKTLLQAIDFPGESILLDDDTLYRGNAQKPGKTSDADSLAYVIFTSGTTGNPKGVCLEHRAVVNYVWWAAKQYVKGESVNFPLYTSISFDLTVTSLFVPLVTGNTILVYGIDTSEFLIEKVIRENKVEAVKLTPSHLKLIVNGEAPGEDSKLRRLVVGGEELETQTAADVTEFFSGTDIEIYNEYGPTEAAVGCMIYRYKSGEDKRRSVPIGAPADNMKIYLLDRHHRPVPMGVTGEIYISGDGVARGYLNRPEMTIQKFPENPFNPGQRMYKTGDLARRLEKGGLEFLGRIDEQVNIRGFRVELGEIRSALLKYNQIKDAVVVTSNDGGDGLALCAYVVTGDGETPDIAELKGDLATALPNYMIPAYFVFIDEIPLTSNGKLDKKALPKPTDFMERITEYVPPQTDTEKKLVDIWKKELGLEKLGIMDSFFTVGGDSIKSLRLLNAINKTFDVDLKLAHLYQNETIKGFAPVIEQHKNVDSTVQYKDELSELEEMKNAFLEEI